MCASVCVRVYSRARLLICWGGGGGFTHKPGAWQGWASGALEKVGGGGEWALPGSGGRNVEAWVGHGTAAGAGESERALQEQEAADARRRFILELIPASLPSNASHHAALDSRETDSPATSGHAQTLRREAGDKAAEEEKSGGGAEEGAGSRQAVTPGALAGRVVALHMRCRRCVRWAAWGPPARDPLAVGRKLHCGCSHPLASSPSPLIPSSATLGNGKACAHAC